jgi:hypothetical protein
MAGRIAHFVEQERFAFEFDWRAQPRRGQGEQQCSNRAERRGESTRPASGPGSAFSYRRGRHGGLVVLGLPDLLGVPALPHCSPPNA